MTNLTQSSPFNTVRRFDEYGGEFWTGRELMPLLQYTKWQRFEDAIDRAKVSCKIAGSQVTDHFTDSGNVVNRPQGGGSTQKDYNLSRYACHLIAMNGDVRKEAIAQAQAYFSAKAYEAEVVIPQQDAELERLKIQLAIAQANADMVKNERLLFEQRKTIYEFHGETGLLVIDGKAPVVIDQPTIEVIDDKHKAHFKGQTLKQVAEYVAKRYGVKLKNGGSVAKILKSAEKDSLIAHVPRAVVQEYIPQEHLQEVYRLVTEGSRQMLLGE